MNAKVVEVPVALAQTDELRFPDVDRALVQPHLTHYLSRCDVLPAVTVRVGDEGVFVVRGHKYLAAAIALGRPLIRAVVETQSPERAVGRLLARPDVRELDWGAIESAEAVDPVPLAWHVLFFERPLETREKAELAGAIDAVFRDYCPGGIAISYGCGESCAEFCAPTPVFDHDWSVRLLGALHTAHRDIAP